MYGVGGERELDEESLPHLSGYEGAFPVRIGNGAYNQQQHDVWGAVLDSVYLHARSREQLPESLWPILKRQVEQAAEHWEEPDRGHLGGARRAAALRVEQGHVLGRAGPRRPAGPDARRARVRRASGRRSPTRSTPTSATNGVDERGVFVQRYGSTALDASLLLLPLMRFLPPDDPRIRATVLAIADELTVDGLVLRYRVEETDDGLSGEEGTFTICSFWLVSALVEIGEVDARPQAVRAAAGVRQPARALRRGDRPATAAGTWATSRRRSPTWR